MLTRADKLTLVPRLVFPSHAGFHATATRCKVVPHSLKGRSSSSQQWLTRQLNDPYVRKARYANYRARSAFKLIEIDDKYKLLRPGMTVVECGAAPGAWTQVLVERCITQTGRGFIVAIDRNPINPVVGANLLPNTDFTSPAGQAQILTLLSDRTVDFLCSDMAPNATGVSQLDHEGIMNLAFSAMSFGLQVLKPGGTFLTKVWNGHRVPDMTNLLQKFFRQVREVKPPASRCNSAELFILADEFTGIRK